MTLGEKIVSLRKTRGLSQEELAITLNVSRQAVSKWETGEATPDTDKIVALADYFVTTADWLLRDIEPAAAVSDTAGLAEWMLRGVPMLLRLTTGGSLFGLALLLYDLWQQTYYHIPSILGVFLQIGMCALFLGVCAALRGQDCGAAALWRARFWRINIWLVAFFPSLLFISVLLRLCPWPYRAFFALPAGLAVYFLICGAVMFSLRKKG